DRLSPMHHGHCTYYLNSRLSSTLNLQSIVSASFDESDENYKESTEGLTAFNVDILPRKLIGPL
ncbi:hypothetical protein, partial [Aeromonas veronii]|uniref:hypothetical protein n=1 Tax=Aeromonas veronii TaxID=654 RepID=UPI002B465FBC